MSNDSLHSVQGGTPCASDLEERLARAQAQLASGDFWEAHETLEPVWLSLPRRSAAASRVRAVIQLAAALHKPWQPAPGPDAALEEGARRILARALQGWRAGREALPAPEPLEHAFHEAHRAASAWTEAAAHARAQGSKAPAGSSGIALPLTLWVHDLQALCESPDDRAAASITASRST